MKTNYEKTMENFREYLKSSSHNMVGESFKDSSSGGFICESITSTNRMIIKIRVDEAIKFVFLTVYAGLTIPKPYRNMAMEYCMKENNKKKISFIGVDDEYGDVYVHIESSFKDAPLSGETLKDLEGIAMTTLEHSFNDLQQIARGVLMYNNSNDDENKKFDLLSRLCGDMDLPDSDDDEDDISSHIPDIDFDAMVSRIESGEDDEDDVDYDNIVVDEASD